MLYLKKAKDPIYTDCETCNKQVKTTLKNCSISGSGSISIGGYCHGCHREYSIVMTEGETTVRYMVT